MVYVKFSYGTDYCRTDGEEYQVFDEKNSNRFDEIAAELGNVNAERYEYLVETTFGNEITEEEKENEIEEYYQNAYFSWKEVTQEEYEENA